MQEIPGSNPYRAKGFEGPILFCIRIAHYSSGETGWSSARTLPMCVLLIIILLSCGTQQLLQGNKGATSKKQNYYFCVGTITVTNSVPYCRS